jgi:hypothetical protein
MAQQDTVTLTARVVRSLQLARQQVWTAQTEAAPRIHEALTELDNILEDQIAALANAAVDDKVDAKTAWAA